MPHVDILFGQLQSKEITPSSAHTAVSLFVSNVQKIRNEIEEPDYAQGESRRHIYKLTVDARESCDVIIVQCRERFSFRVTQKKRSSPKV